MGGVGLEAVPDSAMNASLRPDSALGVTVLAISAHDARYQHVLDEIAAKAAAACFVEELCCSATAIAYSNNPKGGTA